jgi:hypothetical protein
MRLTASIAESLTCTAGKTDITYFDDSLPGFGLRCRASGVRRWVVQYEHGGRTRRITVGDPAIIGIEEARRIARQHLAKRTLGHDPALDKVEARKAARHTLGAVIEKYLKAKAPTLRKSTVEHLGRYLRDCGSHCIPCRLLASSAATSRHIWPVRPWRRRGRALGS